MKKVLGSLLAIAAIAASAISCTKAETPLSYSGDTVIEFTANGGTKVITVKGDNEITLTASAKWVKATNAKNDITIEVGAVPSESDRKATLTVSNGIDTPIEFTIKQEGGVFNFAPEAEYVIPLAGGSFEIPFETNFEFEITSEQPWLKIETKAAAVAISAEASTAARETKVSYLAGSNSGEFVVRQLNPVEVEFRVYTTDYNASFTKKNSIFYDVAGKDITFGARIIVKKEVYEANGEKFFIDMLSAKPNDYAFDATGLANINGKGGLFGERGKDDGAEYVVALYVTNGYDSKFLTGSATTDVEEDPILHIYGEADGLSYFTSKDAIYGEYDLYASGSINQGTSWGLFTKSNKLGTVTISDGGTKTYDSGVLEYVNVDGFYAAFAPTIAAVSRQAFTDQTLNWRASKNEAGYWCLFPEFAPLGANTGTDKVPSYKFMEWIALGNGYLDLPAYLPLVGVQAKNGYIVFVDTGSLDQKDLGFKSWCVCGISMANGQIQSITGQYLQINSFIFVPKAPVAMSSKLGYRLDKLNYKSFAANMARTRIMGSDAGLSISAPVQTISAEQ